MLCCLCNSQTLGPKAQPCRPLGNISWDFRVRILELQGEETQKYYSIIVHQSHRQTGGDTTLRGRREISVFLMEEKPVPITVPHVCWGDGWRCCKLLVPAMELLKFHWESAKMGVGVRFWRIAPRVFSSREMKTTCVTKEKHAIPRRIPHSYLNRMKIFCELPARVLMLMTLLFHCLHMPQEGRILLWKDEDKQDQASHWLGWG